MITFDEFIQKYDGKIWGYPTINDYPSQCLSLTKWHIKEVYGIEPPASGCNGARCYWSIFPNPLGTVLKKIPNTPDLIPKRGWIAVWNSNVGNGYGHIASVLSANVNTFESLDQNWNGKQAHRVIHNYNNVYGFLAPLNESEGDDMSDYDEAIRKAVAYDSVCEVLKQPTTTSKEETVKKLSEIISDKERYLRERNEARVERDNYAEEIKGLNVQIELLKKDIQSLNEELENCNTQVPGEEDLESDYEITGRKIIKQVGDTTVETTYKVKE